MELLIVPPATVIGPPVTLTRLMPWGAPLVVTLAKVHAAAADGHAVEVQAGAGGGGDGVGRCR